MAKAVLRERKNQLVNINASDGCGIMLPSLAERWSKELRLNYSMCGCNLRMAFLKGMVFTFDFLDFAENVAHNYMVKDAWGNEADMRNVELIITTSMLKLWDSYSSCEEYLNKSIKNKYTFAITKNTPERLENKRCLNYQFIQGFDLSDEDINELVTPTLQEFHDVLKTDWRKTVLFLKGTCLNDRNIDRIENDYVKAIMVDQRMMNDPYIQSTVYKTIRRRIDEAKVGVVKVHGNYSIVSGDPYLLCQHIFEMPLTGLLKSGQIYNKYWSDIGAEKVVCFRAPMSCSNNVRLLHPTSNDETSYWYRYMDTCTILNAWDTAMIALNGMDKHHCPLRW